MNDALYPPSMAEHGTCRSLEELYAELRRGYDALPETHYAARGKLLARMRAVESAISMRSTGL